ncbi:MAG TPA: alpha/beta hydrolase [Polyangia bacterium]|nr:alpha/beta hydrolase [Polyangia bacterium]
MSRLRAGADARRGDAAWHELVAPYRHEEALGDHTLHYIDVGRGEPVVMVHGWADSSYTWHRNLGPLRDAGARVILVDQPGLGRSAIPRPPYRFTIENQAAAVLALVTRLGLERFHLVGSSLGGAIALYLCLREPARVRRAVVLAPTCYRPRRLIMAWPGMAQLGTILAGGWTGRWMIRAGLWRAYRDRTRIDDALIDECSRPLGKPGYVHALAGLRRDFFSPAFEELVARYGDLVPPLLIVWGNEDRWNPKTYGDRLHAAVPGSQYRVIRGCGHLPHQERADVVNPWLADFLLREGAAT